MKSERKTRELLFACVRDDDSSDNIERLISEGASLPTVSALARSQGVSTLAHRSLSRSRIPSDDAGREALKKLRISHLESSALNDTYKDELRSVLVSLASRGVRAIPLKGIILSERLYGDAVGRGYSVDTDILIREDDRPAARAALEGIGYKYTEVDELPARRWHDRFDKARERMIELHWDVTMAARSKERIEGLWSGAVLSEWNKAPYYSLDPEELLLYLSAHMVNSDSFRKLRYVCDIDRLLKKYSGRIDRKRLIEKAASWQLSGSLYAALTLASGIFDNAAARDISEGMRLSVARKRFIRFFADKRIYFPKGLKRLALDTFLSYTLFEFFEAERPAGFAGAIGVVLFGRR